MANLDPNGVPILDLSDKSRKRVTDHDGLLTGAVVYLDNRRPAANPVGSAAAGVTQVHVGGETLDEALKSIVGLFDVHHSGAPGDPATFESPGWVASSNDILGKLLAEHYGCELRKMSEVSP